MSHNKNVSDRCAPTRAEHLIFARKSSISPLVAQCTITYSKLECIHYEVTFTYDQLRVQLVSR